MKKLTGMLVYVQLNKPVPCYDKEKGSEFKAGVVVDEDTADAFAEIYPKQAAKKVKRTEFEKIYKVAPPEGDEKNLYVITLKKNSKLANGNDIPEKYRPRVFEQVEGSRLDVTYTKLPANGSYGTISIDHYENDYGAHARLMNILVTDMIEYEGGDEYESGSEFDGDEDESQEAKEAKETPKKPAKPASKAPEKESAAPAKVTKKAAVKPPKEDEAESSDETEDAPW